jgi:integrase
MKDRHRNDGLRKRCQCARRLWPCCAHAWHLNYKWKGKHYRLSLDREAAQPIRTKAEAKAEAERIRIAVRAGKFRTPAPQTGVEETTFRQFAQLWRKREGSQLASAAIDVYRLRLISDFPLPGTDPPELFGDKRVAAIALGDLEAFREGRRAQGRSPVTVNHDLKLLRKMFNWGIRKGYVERTPFKIGTEPAIRLDRETPRNRRFESEDDEQKLLDAATPHLRAVVTALLETACRPGEILSLQWRDVSLERDEILIRAEKAKTRSARIIPISSRLRAVLELRQLDPRGETFGPEAFVFGDAVGRRVKSVREAWKAACAKAGISGFQLRDLRHEAGSRFEEAGIPITYVSKLLGHTNLTTTSRYLNIHRRELHRMMQRFETVRQERQLAVAQTLHKGDSTQLAVVSGADTMPAKQSPVS